MALNLEYAARFSHENSGTIIRSSSLRAGSVKLPRDLSGAEVCRALKRLGFEFLRQTGSHAHCVKGPLHPCVLMHRQIKPKTLQSILKQANLTNLQPSTFNLQLSTLNFPLSTFTLHSALSRNHAVENNR
jgi:predicted RNA binding protein YcfA (HicA-like mRNA interferase family)